MDRVSLIVAGCPADHAEDLCQAIGEVLNATPAIASQFKSQFKPPRVKSETHLPSQTKQDRGEGTGNTLDSVFTVSPELDLDVALQFRELQDFLPAIPIYVEVFIAAQFGVLAGEILKTFATELTKKAMEWTTRQLVERKRAVIVTIWGPNGELLVGPPGLERLPSSKNLQNAREQLSRLAQLRRTHPELLEKVLQDPSIQESLRQLLDEPK